MGLPELPTSESRKDSIDCLFNLLPCGVGLTNFVGEIQRANSRLAELLQLRELCVSGTSIFACVEPSDALELRTFWRLLFGGKLDEFRMELRLAATNGAPRWTRWTVGRFTSREDHGGGGIVLVEDAALLLSLRQDAWQSRTEFDQRFRQGVADSEPTPPERDQAQRQPPQAEAFQTLGQLSAGVAHDVNHSLAEITTRCELMLRESGLLPHVIDQISQILNAAERCSATLGRIMRHANPRPESIQPVNLSAVTEQLPRLTRHRWQSPT